MNDEAIDPRPDPKTFRLSMLDGKPPEERRAILDAMMERSNDEARARRGGRPLQPGDLGLAKGRLPTITYLVRQKADGTWEPAPDDESPRRDDSEEERRR